MNDRPLKILLVAMSNSIHTARWIRQLAGQGWNVRLFPSIDHGMISRELAGIEVYDECVARPATLPNFLKRSRLYRRPRSFWGLWLRPRLSPTYQQRQLRKVIREYKPDIVHSLEFQAAGYLTLEVKKHMQDRFPAWIATNWGSDIYHFRQFPEHESKIREILALCDYYSCECQRDVCLAQGLGLKGKVLPVLPNAGGLKQEEIYRLRQPGPISSRRVVMLKGYQHWVGRALVGLAALEQCTDVLRDYKVVMHSVSPVTQVAASKFQKCTGVKVTMLPRNTPHRDVLAMYGRTRMALGLSLSDGISTSFLEALAMGAFPIQSWTACADEWIEDGKSGLLVPPEDVDAVASAVRRALTDDVLVDQAAELNADTTRRRLDDQRISEVAVDYYRTVARDKGIACSG
jgi:hypothetical protein